MHALDLPVLFLVVRVVHVLGKVLALLTMTQIHLGSQNIFEVG